MSRKKQGRFLALGVCFFVAPVYWWIVSGFGRDFWFCFHLCSAYDSMAAHLLQGDVAVDRAAAAHEVVFRNGSAYLYFGPFPAVLRIIGNVLAPRLYGRWTSCSMMLGACLSVFGFGSLIAYCLERNPHLNCRRRIFYLLVFALTFGLGTPMLFLLSQAQIYNEAVVWGMCGSVLCIRPIMQLLSGSGRTACRLLTSVLAGLTLLARPTFAIPLYLCIAVLGVAEAKRGLTRGTHPVALRLLELLGPAAILLIFQLWLNYGRFGNPLQFLPPSLSYLDLNQVPFWSFERFTATLSNYFGLSGVRLSSVFPYVAMAPRTYSKPQLFVWVPGVVLSLPISSPALLLASLLGLCHIIFKGHNRLRLCLAAFFAQAVIILFFHHCTQRYAVEFLPLMIFSGCHFVCQSNWLESKRVLLIVIGLALLSIYVTMAATHSYVLSIR